MTLSCSWTGRDPNDGIVGPGVLSTAWQARHTYYLGDSILDSNGHWQRVTTAGTSGYTPPTWNSSGGTTAENPPGTAIRTDQGLYPGGFPNLLTQLQLVTDGTTWYSPLQINRGGQFLEDVTDLNGTPTIYANGILQIKDTDYTIAGPGLAVPGASFLGMYLAWASEPAAPITAAFRYHYRVRFETDAQDFDRFMNTLWTIGGHGARGAGELKLVSCRPANATPSVICPPVPECPAIIPMPPPEEGLLRVIIGPRECHAVDGSCGSADAGCGDGTVAGTGTAARWHGSPLGDPPVCYWSQFLLPDWLSPSQVRWVRFVFAYAYSPAAKMAVGGFPYRIGNADHWMQGTIHDESSAVLVSDPYSGTSFNFNAVTADGGIAWTLDDPPGACGPCCGGGGTCPDGCYASLGMGDVCLVVDYQP